MKAFFSRNDPFFWLLAGMLCACSASSPPASNSDSTNRGIVGSYQMDYDAESGDARITMIDKATGKPITDPHFVLDYGDSTGLDTCAIRDTNVTDPTEVNYCMGLVDPDSCSTDYNTVTKTLSFYARIINKSDTTYYSNVRYQFANGAADHDVTYLAPFYFKLAGVWWDSTTVGLVQTVNTNLRGADCGGDGLQLAGAGPPVDDDIANNGYFDCIYPDTAPPLVTDALDPGWDFTPYSGISMIPGEDSGCVQFMQFQLSANEDIHIAFDLLGIRQAGGTPATPTISTPADNSYTNSTTITLTGTCTTGGTIYAEGGSSGISPTSVACIGSAFTLVNVPINSGAANQVYVYQVVSSVQSGSAILNITHDSTAPTIVGSSPADSESGVSTVTNYTVTFSEAMLQSTFNTGSSCNPFNGTFGLCNGLTHVPGTLTYSSDNTQVVFTPTTKPLASGTTYTFRVVSGVSGVKDLASNALGADSNRNFITAAAGISTDSIPPFIRSVVPADSATVSPSTDVFTITFSEEINPSTIVGNVVDAACQTNGTGTAVPNVTVYESGSCGAASPQPMCGTTSLSADGKTATFVLGGAAPSGCKSAPLNNSACYATFITSCVQDLFGNALPNINNYTVSAYGGRGARSNKLNFFFTATDSATFTATTTLSSPTLSSVSSVTNLVPGMTIAGTNIPSGTRIVSITSPTITMSKNATAGGTGITVTATSYPSLVHVGPRLAQGSVTRRNYPFVILDKPIDPATIIPSYFYMNITGDTTTIPLTLGFDPFLQMITYKPTSSLASSTNYLMTITGAVADISANLMVSPQTSNYTTGTSVDDGLAPSVIQVTPTASSISSKCSTIDIDFSEAMDSTTLNSTNVYLSLVSTGQTFPSQLTISDDLQHVTVKPDGSLPTNYPFTANTTSGNTSLSSVSSVTGLIVGMLLTGTGIPANTTIANIGATTITMSAAATATATAVSITGTQRFTATTTNTSTTLTNAFSPGGLILGRALSGTGIPGGRTISAIGTTSVTMSGNVSSAGTGTVTSTGTFTADRVSGSTTLTSVSSMAGLTLGMTIAGTGIPGGATISALGASTVTMSAAATSTATTMTVTVTSTFNATRTMGSAVLTVAGSTAGLVAGMAISGTGIAANTTISSFPSSTSVLMSIAATASGTVAITAIGRQVQINVSAGAKDLAQNVLSPVSATTFMSANDTTAPTFTVVIPTVGGTTPRNSSLAVFFNESMDRSTLTAANMNTRIVAGASCSRALHPSEDGRFIVLNCLSNMNASTNYQLVIASAPRDYNNTGAGSNLNCEGNAGNTLTGSTTNFTVSATADTTAFTVSSLSPADRAAIATLGTSPTVTFNKEIDPRSVANSTLFLMLHTGERINSTYSFSVDLKTVTINPVANLTNNTVYYIVGTNALRDMMGNAYNGFGGENTTTDDPGVLRSCFMTGTGTCPTPD